MSSENNNGGCFIFIAICCIIAMVSNLNESSDKQSNSSTAVKQETVSNVTASSEKPEKPKEVYDPYLDNRLTTGAKPYSNYYQSRTGDNYLDFKTSGSDFVIIVRDYNTDNVVNHIYVRANDRGRLYLPNGVYNIFFYSGKGWNPNKIKGSVKGGFVTDEYLQKDGPVNMHGQYGEYTLYPVQNGNLTLKHASVDEAF